MPRQTEPYRETEIKLRVTDMPASLAKLRALGAKPVGRVLERNIVFDTDDSDFRHRGRLLRLRTETPAASDFASAGRPNATLTAKAPPLIARGASRRKRTDRYKTVLESEVQVRDPAPPVPPTQRKLRDRGWTFAFGVLGLRVSFRYEKYRTTFAIRGMAKGLHVSLDETPVGTFLELEGSPGAIDRVAQGLGSSHGDYIRSTYFEIYAAECRRRGRPVRNMLFGG